MRTRRTQDGGHHLGSAPQSISLTSASLFDINRNVKLLETKQAVLHACQQLRQAPEDQQANITASLIVAMLLLTMDDALRAAVDDAVHLGLCLVKRPGALERLEALAGGQVAFPSPLKVLLV